MKIFAGRTSQRLVTEVADNSQNTKLVIPAKEVVKKSIVTAMFSEHLGFISESNSDQLKNKSYDRPFLHNLESRNLVVIVILSTLHEIPAFAGMTVHGESKR